MSWSIYLSGKTADVYNELARAATDIDAAMENILTYCEETDTVTVAVSGNAYSNGANGTQGFGGSYTVSREPETTPVINYFPDKDAQNAAPATIN